MKIINTILLLSMFWLGACTKKADVQLPPSENKLVVTCFITPDDSIIVATVRQSKPKFGSVNTNSYSTNYDINNATVLLSDGNNAIQLNYDNDYSFYKAFGKQIKILAGKTYYLSVTVPDGRKVDAKTTVPTNKLLIDQFNFAISAQDSQSVKFTIHATIKDNPGITDYLAVYNQNFHTFKSNDTILSGLDFSNDFGFFDDDEYVVKSNFYFDTDAQVISAENIQGVYAVLTAVSCNRDFYLYNKSVQNAGLNGGNPFADPVLVYSNINNGFGCFGAYLPAYAIKQIK